MGVECICLAELSYEQQQARQERREKRRRASHRRARWWLRAVIALTLLVFATYTAWVSILTPQRVAAFVSRTLEDSTKAKVEVGSARVAFPGVLYIDELEMRLPEMDRGLGRLLAVEHATLSLDFSALLQGELKADKLSLDNPVVYVSELPELERYNYQLLPLGEDEPLDDEPQGIAEVPEIHILGGRLQFGVIRDGEYELAQRVDVSGRMLRDPRDPGWFAFMLRQQLENSERGPTLTGHVNLVSGAFDAELDQLSIDSPQRNLVPERFRQWWDRMNPSGSFAHASVRHDPESEFPWTAEIEVDGIGLTLPFGEKPINLKMAAGTIRFAENAVLIEGFKGNLDKVRYAIDGRYEGISVDAPFKIDARLSGQWTHDPDVIATIPEKVAKHINRFKPQGRFKGVVSASRGLGDSPLEVDGRIELLDVSMLYHKFPYPMKNGSGVITFTRDQIRLIGLTGNGSQNSVISCDGVIDNPGPAAEVTLNITGQSVPIDQPLLDAMKEDVRSLTQMFFDEPSHETIAKMIDLPPVGGKADLKVTIERPAGVGMRTVATVEATPATPIAVSFRHWPYPLMVEAGRLIIKPREFVKVQGVEVSSPTGVIGRVEGDLLPHESSGKLVPDLRFEMDRMPVDDVLLATLPPSHAEHLRDLKIAGTVAAIGTVFHSDATGRIEFDLRANLVDGKAAPFGGGRVLEPLTAEFQVRRHELVLDSAQTWHGGGEYQLDGHLQWATPPDMTSSEAAAGDARPAPNEFSRDEPKITLHATGSQIVIDQTLLDLVPPETEHLADVRKMLEERNITGVADIDVTYRGHGDERTFDMVCEPATLAFDKRNTRVAVRDMSGQLIVQTDKVRIEDIAGVFGETGEGRFDLSGDATFEDGLKLEAVANLQADLSNDVGRVMLPRNMIDTIDRLSISGKYDLQNVRVMHHPSATAGDELQVAGMATFDNVSASLGSTDVQRLDGEVKVALRQPAGAKHPLVDSYVQLHRMALAGRPVRKVSMRLVSDAEDPSRLLLRDLTGIAAGGDLSGQGAFGLEKDADFDIELKLVDAELEQLLRRREVQERRESDAAAAVAATSTASDVAAPSPKIEATGLVSAELDLAGILGEPEAAKGRGYMQVHEARLYELPVVLGMLQLINLALPVSSSFDEAAVAFQIEGETALLDRISFEARGVQIAGSGTMNYRTQQVDIMLTTRNPEAPDIWPISDLFNAVKDELVKVHITGTLKKPRTRLAGIGPQKGDAQADARSNEQ